jgi:hypothetical protein
MRSRHASGTATVYSLKDTLIKPAILCYIVVMEFN